MSGGQRTEARRTHGRWVAALAVVLALAVPSTAAAGTFIGKAGGFIYRANSTTIAPGTSTGSTVSCGSRANITGGGASLTGAPTRSYIGSMSSLAQFGNPNKWFAASTVRAGATGATYGAFAICSRKAGPVGTTTGTLGPNTAASAQAGCPNGDLLGGGLLTNSISSAFHLERSRPLSGSRWEGRVRRQGLGSSSFTVEAYCSTHFTSRTVQSPPTTVPPGQSRTVAIICPHARHVSGGGGASIPANPGPGFVDLTRSYPIDDRSDTDKTPDDGWRTTVHNGSSQPEDVVSYAVCARLAVN